MFSIVIPAYNEGDSVSKTVLFIRDVMDTLNNPFEIIVVNDGSTDSTKDHCQFDDARIRLISHIQNLGYGASLKTGIRSASYDTIIITDADLTYPFEELPKLLKDYNAGFDMVVGRRTGEFYRESAIKSPLRKILKGLVEFAAGRSIPDINSGFRIFKKKDVTPFLNRLCNTFSFTTSMTLAYMMNLKTVSYVDIPYHKREGQTKVRLFKDAMRTLQYIIQAIIFTILLNCSCCYFGYLWAFQLLLS